jgi:hypothetical protein
VCAGNWTRGAPASGIIVHSNSTIWFAGSNTRHEERDDGKVTTIYMTGDQAWSAYPTSGRMMAHSPTAFNRNSFPEETRSFFHQTARTNWTRLGEEVVQGFPCWKYSMKERRQADDGRFLEEAMWTYYFLANPQFGTFSARWTMGGDIAETHEVLRLHVWPLSAP